MLPFSHGRFVGTVQRMHEREIGARVPRRRVKLEGVLVLTDCLIVATKMLESCTPGRVRSDVEGVHLESTIALGEGLRRSPHQPEVNTVPEVGRRRRRIEVDRAPKRALCLLPLRGAVMGQAEARVRLGR